MGLVELLGIGSKPKETVADKFDQQAILEYLKKARTGDIYTYIDPKTTEQVSYELKPGSYIYVAGEEEDPFIRAYLNSISNLAGGRKFFPQRIKKQRKGEADQ